MPPKPNGWNWKCCARNSAPEQLRSGRVEAARQRFDTVGHRVQGLLGAGTALGQTPLDIRKLDPRGIALLFARFRTAFGIVQLIQGQILLGLILIVVGCAVGPGGWSIFRTRGA